MSKSSSNHFAESHPEISKEWHPTKNGERKPSDYTYGSGYKAWWVCSITTCSHEWPAHIKRRSHGSGCPACAGKIVTDRNRLTVAFSEVAKEWHPEKNGLLNPTEVSFGSSKKVWWKCNKDNCAHEWPAPVFGRTQGSGCPACSGSIVSNLNRLSIKFPNIAMEWHPEKNGLLNPTEVSFGSSKTIWWKCIKANCAYEWPAPALSRTQGSGCPACSGSIVSNLNRLLIKFPNIAMEWHPEKNGLLNPTEVSFGSSKTIWWKCSKDNCAYEWPAPVRSRTQGRGCPACAGVVVSDTNRLSLTHPDIAAEWHPDPEINNNLKSTEVSYGSQKVIIWQCRIEDCVFEWPASVKSRTNGSGCPACVGKVVTERNRLSSLFPETSKEWHPEKNGNLTPTDFSYGSKYKIWWKCIRKDCGHEWDACIVNRTQGEGCPSCSGNVVSDRNRLTIKFPDLVKDWNHNKNGDLLPSEVSYGSTRKVWWKCKNTNCSYEWNATIGSRSQGTGCQKCFQLNDLNRLSIKFPELAKEWCQYKNGEITPADISYGSGSKFWWACRNKGCSNIWPASVASRSNGNGCPNCANYGFRKDKIAFIYLISNDNLLKIGIFNNGSSRLKIHERNGWNALELIGPLAGFRVFNLESYLKNKLSESGILTCDLSNNEIFDGYTESWEKRFLSVNSFFDLFRFLGVDINDLDTDVSNLIRQTQIVKDCFANILPDTCNPLLNTEADDLCQEGKYEKGPDQLDTNDSN